MNILAFIILTYVICYIPVIIYGLITIFTSLKKEVKIEHAEIDLAKIIWVTFSYDKEHICVYKNLGIWYKWPKHVKLDYKISNKLNEAYAKYIE